MSDGTFFVGRGRSTEVLQTPGWYYEREESDVKNDDVENKIKNNFFKIFEKITYHRPTSPTWTGAFRIGKRWKNTHTSQNCSQPGSKCLKAPAMQCLFYVGNVTRPSRPHRATARRQKIHLLNTHTTVSCTTAYLHESPLLQGVHYNWWNSCTQTGNIHN